jgi:cyclopropane fatty-acyl-phospholipid synthase-like methyltransferase
VVTPADTPGVDYKQLVRQGYDQCAERYSQARQREENPELAFLQRHLGDQATVLDIGCGGGVPVCSTLAHRCVVTGVDISPVQIDLAQRQVPGGHFLCGDIMGMSFPEGHFDAVVSFYAIFHLPKEEHRELFTRIHHWLKPKGYFMGTVAMEDEAPYTEDDFFGVTMYWSNYGVRDYRQMLEGLGFTLRGMEELGSGYRDGLKVTTEIHPLIFAQKG